MAQYQRKALLAVFVLGLLFLWRRDLLLHPSPFPSPSPSEVPPAAAGSLILTGPPQALDPLPDLSSARAPFVAWPLRRVCAETTYVPGLAFVCDNNSGGPGNIRNYILTCVRYAIEAGATSLVLPRIRARAPDDPADLFREHRPLGYMFDAGHFAAALGAVCPRLAVRADLSAVPGVEAKARREGLTGGGGGTGGLERMVRRVMPKSFGGSRAGCDARDQNRHTDRFGDAFRAWVAERRQRTTAADDDGEGEREEEKGEEEEEDPVLVRFSWGVLWDWQVYRDGPELAASFGGLLRIREDILGLAEGIVASLRASGATAFLGIHLRTEEDALAQWPTYAEQSEGYFREAERRGFRGGMAYLASGSEAEARRFGEQARARLQLDVRSKHDLVDGPDLERLRAMSWDQQALVDFVVLLNSDYFVGVSPSSFSINIALKRHLQKEGLVTRPWKVGGPGDGRSWLVGRYDRYWDDWLFMFDGMWP